MKILVVKLTSMGDVLHLMPAINDLLAVHPQAQIDWMVEESFAELPAWHFRIVRVIPVATRRWRKVRLSTVGEFFRFLRELRRQRYDVVIDAQGLMKSAVFARFARLDRNGQRIGFSANSIKESPAARLYSKAVDVPREQHAIARLRQLLAGGLEYPQPINSPDYALLNKEPARDYTTVMFFHGTTWPSKHLPESMWQELIILAKEDGYKVELPWGNQAERQRAERLAQNHSHTSVLERQSLSQLKERLGQVAGAVAVDTGLGHLAAALGTPCVSIYGSTNAELTGALGENQKRLQSTFPCSPCLAKECRKLSDTQSEPPCYSQSDKNGGLSAAQIWETLYEKIA